MEKNLIPVPYKVILKRFWKDSEFGKLGRHKARILLTKIFRMDNRNVPEIFREMESMGLIKVESLRCIVVVVPIKDLV